MKKEVLKKDAQIESRKIEIRCADGRRVKGYIDTNGNCPQTSPVVIICHGYGETKRDYISTSYYLVSNGFTVLRYDCLNHLGESEGDIIDFTLNDMAAGLSGALSYAKEELGATRCGVIASSLSSRVALKLATKEKSIKYLIALTSVVNLRDTLSSLYKEDLLGEYKAGTRWGVLDILGFEVKDALLEEAIKNDYEDIDSTIADLKQIDIPVCYLVAGDDAWIRYEDMQMVYKNTMNKNSKFITIPSALHQIQENPRMAQMTILKIVETCGEYAGFEPAVSGGPCKPSIHSIVAQNKAEMANLKSIFSVTKQDEKNFWVSYLSKFFVVMKSKDYQNLLSLAAQLLSEIKDGCRIVDAGCGNGHFGAWLLCNMDSIVKKGTFGNRISYTGVDFAQSALLQARDLHAEILSKLPPESSKKIMCDLKYICEDLEESVSIENNTIDKICCNLVVSYLKDPVSVLISLHAKLKPSGRIVVSTLKPYSDLSLIYKNYLDQNLTPEDILEGRNLLSSAGKIRHKEKQGHYHFFSEEELEKLMKDAGFKQIKVYRAFGNQANVAVAEK